MNARRMIIHAGLIADGSGLRHAPGAILLDGNRIVASGSPQSIGQLGRETPVHNLPDRVILPAFVNAHAHLDLSHIGPVPYSGDFVGWVDLIRERRAIDRAGIADSVKRGAQLALAGGTGLIGDVAGAFSIAAIEALRETGLRGVSYLEVFGQGATHQRAVAVMRSAVETLPQDERGVRLGLQPHAPYSCAVSVYEHAAATGVPLATHLAETQEEVAFVHSGDGPLAGLLRDRGVWDDSITGWRCHPVEHLAHVLSETPFVAAHLNYLEAGHIEAMAGWPITVAYCPRASAYFGHYGHRYREMIDVGVNVALGTDSIITLDTPDRISVLDDMRFLHRRDGTDPLRLLHMATVAGAKALGFDPALVTLKPGAAVAGLIALPFDPDAGVDPLVQIMQRDDPPCWVWSQPEP